MHVQFIHAPKGEEMVIIPRKEYDSLLEKLQDKRDSHEAKTAMAMIHKGEEELIPEEIVARLIKGANPVRVWRKYRSLTTEQLAKASGLSRTYITQIETGKRTGTVGALQHIAAALGIRLDDIASWMKKGC